MPGESSRSWRSGKSSPDRPQKPDPDGEIRESDWLSATRRLLNHGHVESGDLDRRVRAIQSGFDQSQSRRACESIGERGGVSSRRSNSPLKTGGLTPPRSPGRQLGRLRQKSQSDRSIRDNGCFVAIVCFWGSSDGARDVILSVFQKWLICSTEGSVCGELAILNKHGCLTRLMASSRTWLADACSKVGRGSCGRSCSRCCPSRGSPSTFRLTTARPRKNSTRWPDSPISK